MQVKDIRGSLDFFCEVHTETWQRDFLASQAFSGFHARNARNLGHNSMYFFILRLKRKIFSDREKKLEFWHIERESVVAVRVGACQVFLKPGMNLARVWSTNYSKPMPSNGLEVFKFLPGFFETWQKMDCHGNSFASSCYANLLHNYPVCSWR